MPFGSRASPRSPRAHPSQPRLADRPLPRGPCFQRSPRAAGVHHYWRFPWIVLVTAAALQSSLPRAPKNPGMDSWSRRFMLLQRSSFWKESGIGRACTVSGATFPAKAPALQRYRKAEGPSAALLISQVLLACPRSGPLLPPSRSP